MCRLGLWTALFFSGLLIPCLARAAVAPCATGDLFAQNRCLMIEAVENNDSVEVTKLAASPYVNVSEDLTNKPGAGQMKSYLQAAFFWPPRYNAASALLAAGEDVNTVYVFLGGLIGGHYNDPALASAIDFLLDNKLDPNGGTFDLNGDFSYPFWVTIFQYGCRTRSPVFSQILTSFATHGANFSSVNSAKIGHGNIFHLLSYFINLWQEGSGISNAAVVDVCPYDWAVIKDAADLLSKKDDYGNTPVDLIGWFNGYPESSSCIYYTQWPYKQYLNTTIFDSWIALYTRLGSAPPRPIGEARNCVVNPLG